MNVTGEGGKGSARRKGANDKAYADNYDRIFSKVKCPVCGSTDVELEWIELPFDESTYYGDCKKCEHEWSECARD